MQDPHSPCSQAFFEPGRPTRSRRTYSRLSPSQTSSASARRPLTVKVTLMAGPSLPSLRSAALILGPGPGQGAARHHRQRVPAVGGGAADVVDRAGRGGHQLAEPPRDAGSTRRGRPSPARRRRTARPRTPGAGSAPAEPMPVPTCARSRSSATAKEQTAITIALRVPIFENCCGPGRGRAAPPGSARPAPSALRLTPSVELGRRDRAHAAAADSTSMTASVASSAGCASPAGEAAPRLPPTVPRLRICGEPTVRAAMARPGSRSPSSSMIRA